MYFFVLKVLLKEHLSHIQFLQLHFVSFIESDIFPFFFNFSQSVLCVKCILWAGYSVNKGKYNVKITQIMNLQHYFMCIHVYGGKNVVLRRTTWYNNAPKNLLFLELHVKMTLFTTSCISSVLLSFRWRIHLLYSDRKSSCRFSTQLYIENVHWCFFFVISFYVQNTEHNTCFDHKYTILHCVCMQWVTLL